ncbi:MAG: RNase H family protein [Acidobacteriota bacterium]
MGQRPAPQSAAAPERKLPPADAEVFLKVACAKGTGGWAALLRRPKVEGLEEGMVVQGPRAEGVTSNRLDILAATQILEGFEQGETVAFYTGSEYLRKGAAQWLDGWRRKGWKTSTGKPVSNAEEWQSLDAAQRRLKVRWPELPERKLPRSKDLEGAAKASRMGESWEPKED